jgi:phosphoglycerate dehydrogenase-like enzyme
MGMRVIGVRQTPSPSPAADEVVGLDRLQDVLGDADYVSVILPLTREDAQSRRRPGVRRHEEGRLLHQHWPRQDRGRGGADRGTEQRPSAGATIDVFATEPLPAESPFWDMENVIVLRMRAATPPTGTAGGPPLLRQSRALDQGEPLFNVVDPQRGY